MPPTALSVDETVQHVRAEAGYARLGDWGLVDITGPDAASFLQSQTTHDVLGLSDGQGQLTALLDRKAHIDAVFSLHRLAPDHFWLVAETSQISTILARLERYHFSEQLTMADLSPQYELLTVQGPKTTAVLKLHSEGLPTSLSEGSICTEIYVFSEPVTTIKRSLTGEEGLLVVIAKESGNNLASNLQMIEHLVEISPEAMNVLRVEAGIPRYGTDMDTDVMLPSTGLQHTTVSYTKGCYLGQEVVAKVRTHGSIQKGLVGLIFPDISQPLPTPSDLMLDGHPVGKMTSSVYSPTCKAVIALAYLSREHRVPDKSLSLTIQDRPVQSRVVMLPFYTPSGTQDRARQQYERAIQQFAHNEEEAAIANLREALEMDPHLADAYEALGVILSRREQYEEAIALMEKWAELAPDEGMPHTNLSVFYMKLGMKEKAEDEKALATTLGFRKAMSEKMQQQSQAQAREAQRKALEEKVAMFREVLELDAEDTLANYGLGNTYVNLEAFDQAVPHLEKALMHDPRYTVAYLALGKALEGLQKRDEAREVYERGIAVASQRGDLMPLNEMQGRLSSL